jgi:hypothetical protein
VAVAALEPGGQLVDGLGLIAARRIGLMELEGHGSAMVADTPRPVEPGRGARDGCAGGLEV